MTEFIPDTTLIAAMDLMLAALNRIEDARTVGRVLDGFGSVRALLDDATDKLTDAMNLLDDRKGW